MRALLLAAAAGALLTACGSPQAPDPDRVQEVWAEKGPPVELVQIPAEIPGLSSLKTEWVQVTLRNRASAARWFLLPWTESASGPEGAASYLSVYEMRGDRGRAVGVRVGTQVRFHGFLLPSGAAVRLRVFPVERLHLRMASPPEAQSTYRVYTARSIQVAGRELSSYVGLPLESEPLADVTFSRRLAKLDLSGEEVRLEGARTLILDWPGAMEGAASRLRAEREGIVPARGKGSLP